MSSRLALLGVLFLSGCSSGRQTVLDAGGGVAAREDASISPDTAKGDARGITDGKAGQVDGAEPYSGSTPAQVCEAAILAQVRQARRCLGGSADYSDIIRGCPDYYFNPDSKRTVAGIAGCLDEFEEIPCTDWNLGLRPACLVGGTRPTGAPCAYPSQCQSNRCSEHGERCGQCEGTVVSRGGKCGLGVPCESGTFCHQKTWVCTSGSTIVHAHEGEPCDLGATPVVGCQGTLVCDTGEAHAFIGTCKTPPSAGRPCASTPYTGMVCAPGTLCSRATDGTCLPEGACGNTTCVGDSYCDANSLSCVPLGREGQACTTASPNYGPSCVAPAACYYGLCVRMETSGDACDGARLCAPFLQCVNGACQPLVCPT